MWIYFWNEAFHFLFAFFICYKCVQMCSTLYVLFTFNARSVLTIQIVRSMFTFWSLKLNCDDFSSILAICYFIIAPNYISHLRFVLGKVSNWIVFLARLLEAHQFCVIETIYLLSPSVSKWLDSTIDCWILH